MFSVWDPRLGPEPHEQISEAVSAYIEQIQPAENLPRTTERALGSLVVHAEVLQDINPAVTLEIGGLVVSAYLTSLYSEYPDLFESSLAWKRFLHYCAGETTVEIAQRNGVATTQINNARYRIVSIMDSMPDGDDAKAALEELILTHGNDAYHERPQAPARSREAKWQGKVKQRDGTYQFVDDPLIQAMYFRGRKTKHLAPEEEVELAGIIRAGQDARTRLAEASGLGTQEYENLQRHVDEAAVATELFVAANLRLVAWAARHYRSDMVDMASLLQAGEDALRDAVLGFNPWSENYASNMFAAYALPAIRGAIRRYYTKNSRSFEGTYAFMQLVSQVGQILADRQTQGRPSPSVGELAAELGRDYNEVLDAMYASQADVYIDETTASGTSVGATIETQPAGGHVEYPFDALRDHPYFQNLTDAEYSVLVFRYGLVDGVMLTTMEEIKDALENPVDGQEHFEYTPQKIRSILTTARKKVEQNLAQLGVTEVPEWLGKRKPKKKQ